MRTSLIDNDHANSAARKCTFSPLRHGGALLRCGTVSKTLDGDDAKAFFDKVRGKEKNTAHVRRIVRSYFNNPQV